MPALILSSSPPRCVGPPRPDEPKEYFPLTDQVIHDHLTGKLTAGVYPLLTDETCWFLAADFDKATWQAAPLTLIERVKPIDKAILGMVSK